MVYNKSIEPSSETIYLACHLQRGSITCSECCANFVLFCAVQGNFVPRPMADKPPATF